MTKNVLKESFEWKVEKRINGGGNTVFAVSIDPSISENTFKYKDEIKKFGARWDGKNKTWFFWVSSDPNERLQQINTQVKPCIEFLKSVEEVPGNKTADETLQGIIKIIDDLINKIGGVQTVNLTTEVNTALDPKTIEEKLKAFKEELIASFNSEEWKEKMMPIIKFRNAQGPGFSLGNSILVWIQDPEAKLVKSKSNWAKANKQIKPGSPAICLWIPKGEKLFKTEEQRKQAALTWFKKFGKVPENATVVNPRQFKQIMDNLTVGEKEKYNRYINKLNPDKIYGFDLRPYWYDVRFTEQMEGTEDLIGSLDNLDDVQWYDGVSKESEKSAQMFDAIIKAIQSAGIEVSYGNETELGGARGVSMSGQIKVLNNAPKTPGTVSTLIHEFSHEMLHQRYLSKNDEYAKYFVGTEKGRGFVEQQAEISAWIVMRYFGYNMQTAVNYAGVWGADEKSCVIVFNTVADVASKIIDKVNFYLGKGGTAEDEYGSLNEALSSMPVKITGLDVAKMLGPDAVKAYQNGLKAQGASMIKENFFSIFNKLTDFSHH